MNPRQVDSDVGTGHHHTDPKRLAAGPVAVAPVSSSYEPRPLGYDTGDNHLDHSRSPFASSVSSDPVSSVLAPAGATPDMPYRIVLLSADPQLQHHVSLIAAGLGAVFDVHPGLVAMPALLERTVVLMDHVTAARYATQRGSRSHLQNHCETVIIVTLADPAVDLWRHAAQVGVRHVYTIPGERELLAEHVYSILSPPRPQHIYAVSAVTAGSGATSLVNYLAQHCKKSLRCVVVDADPQRRGLSHKAKTHHPRALLWPGILADYNSTPNDVDLKQLPRIHDVPALLFDVHSTEPPHSLWDWKQAVDIVQLLAERFDVVLVDLGLKPWVNEAARMALSLAQNWQLIGVCAAETPQDLTQSQLWAEQCPIPQRQRKVVIRRHRQLEVHNMELAHCLQVSGFKSIPWHGNTRHGHRVLKQGAAEIAVDIIEECTPIKQRTPELDVAPTLRSLPSMPGRLVPSAGGSW